ncbi:MAG: DUF3408 domain-containing protein [Bacteroidaceae bacterium]|nr:DUF3408 domain-containing protein [Bacteroidaceae bacterium]
MSIKNNENKESEMQFSDERLKDFIPTSQSHEDGESLAKIAEQVASERFPKDIPPRKEETATLTHRVSSKQRKLSLEEYRATFLQVPRIVNRRPVFVSEEVRQQLDLIVLRLSETRRMSVTGLLENICRHHIETYKDDIEQWRKL